MAAISARTGTKSLPGTYLLPKPY